MSEPLSLPTASRLLTVSRHAASAWLSSPAPAGAPTPSDHFRLTYGNGDESRRADRGLLEGVRSVKICSWLVQRSHEEVSVFTVHRARRGVRILQGSRRVPEAETDPTLFVYYLIMKRET